MTSPTNNMKNSNTKQKGEGNHSSRQLSASEKAKLTIWIFHNKDLCESKNSHDLARLAIDALGFDISESSILTIKNSVHEDLRRVRRASGGTYYSKRKKMESRITALEYQVERLFRELGVKTAE